MAWLTFYWGIWWDNSQCWRSQLLSLSSPGQRREHSDISPCYCDTSTWRRAPAMFSITTCLQVLVQSCHTWKLWAVGRADNCICGNSQNHSLEFSERMAACSIWRDLMVYLNWRSKEIADFLCRKQVDFNTKIHYITVSVFRPTSIR